jgi:transcriptional regulator with XRE-family HTH domain
MENTSRSEHWRRLVTEHASSGLSLRAFAARVGVSPNTIAYWKYKRGVGSSSSVPQILPVTVVADARTAAASIILELDGARVELRPDFDADDVSRLLGILRRTC